jgi:hypothetical protein
MQELTEHIMEEIRMMRDAGQKEYAHDNDNVFANFERVGNLLHVDRAKVLMTYMLKHIDGIVAYINGHESQREDVTGRITDCIVYLTLLWGMIEDDKVSRKEGNPSMHHVWDTIKDANGGISMDTRCVLGDGIPSNDSMPEMRQEGVRKQGQSEEIGEPT